MNSEAYRRQLAESADHIGAAIARAALTCDPLELETLAYQLDGARQLTLHLRNAILTAPAGAGSPPDPDRMQAAA